MNKHTKAQIIIYVVFTFGALLWCLLIAMSLQGMFNGITDMIQYR